MPRPTESSPETRAADAELARQVSLRRVARLFRADRRPLAVVVAATSLIVLFAGSAHAAAGSVHIVNGAPNPSSLTVNNGDTVTIFNDDDVAHAIFANGAQQGPSIPPHTVSTPRS